MPPLTAFALIACALCVVIAVAMASLVLWQAPRARENQLMVVYCLAVGYGAGAVFLARVLSLVGAGASSYSYQYYNACSLSLLALLALSTYYAGWWSRRWVPLLLVATLACILVVQVPLMNAGQLVRFVGYDATGELETRLTRLGQGFLLSLSCVGVLVVLIAWLHQRSRALVPGLLIGAAGPLLNALVPALRPFPITALSAAVAAVLLARCVLRDKLFEPMARRNRELEAEIEERGLLIKELRAFAEVVAHDLKNPLGPIMGAAEILDEGGDDMPASVRRDYARMIGRNAAAMARLIDSLLLIAKLRQSRVERQPVDMRKVIAEVRARLAPEIRALDAVTHEVRRGRP